MIQEIMVEKTISLNVILFVAFIFIGLLLLGGSFTSLLPASLSDKGVRAAGFALLFLGLGEYLNHPAQTKLRYPRPTDDGDIQVPSRRRNPCGLGNVLDVLAIISLFAALAYFFFPHQA